MTAKKQLPVPSSVSPQKDNKKEGPDLEWGGWIDIRMTPEMKEQYNLWAEEGQHVYWDELQDILARGLKHSLSWDKANNCFVAALTGQGSSTIEKRFTMTARSPHMAEAMMLLVYKHVVILKGDWGNFRFDQKYDLNWG
jgi:hypothetical protein